MTAPEVATLIKNRAEASENSARTSGVDELRMSRVRDYVLRYIDKEAMTAFLSGREAVALWATYHLACAHIERPGAPLLEDEDTDPVITIPIDPRGAKR